LEVPADSAAKKSGLVSNDVIIAAGDQAVHTIADLIQIANRSQGKILRLSIIRQQRKTGIAVTL